ncbi:hypothetical protein D8674_000536 [Pyrus ussuriensis x Pyrus communis]|uniref:RNase H type-1 domain-containing protein n=1 Tax=Pyrus ussuriensis x Pyrus communis TaxID=2448454 RepID=A0A5N5F3P3_9ROSA|nr:hypothetical protein D8674_000536 [Pyrus ussuriensis x Pyrus communis]
MDQLICHQSHQCNLPFLKSLSQDGSYCRAQALASAWTKPPLGFLKVNVDGAWSESLKSGEVGVVVRHEHGNFVAASTKTFEHVSSPLLIEAFAVREGLLLAVQWGLHNIIIKSDSFQIVFALQKGPLNSSLIGHIVEDSYAMIYVITRASIIHTRHQHNEAVHCLARFALTNPCEYLSKSLPTFSWMFYSL